MVAEDVRKSVIFALFFWFLLFIKGFLFSIKYREFKFTRYFIDTQKRIIDLTWEEAQLKSIGGPVDGHRHSTSSGTGGAGTTALLNIPLTHHLVELGKSGASFQHDRTILPIEDYLRDYQSLVDDDVDHEDNDKAPTDVVSVLLFEHASGSFDDKAEVSAEEDTALIEQLKVIGDCILVRLHPADVDHAS